MLLLLLRADKDQLELVKTLVNDKLILIEESEEGV